MPAKGFNPQESAEYERKYDSSPIYRNSNTATVAANAFYSVDYEVATPESGRYLPFNFLRITNANTASAVELYVNGQTFITAKIQPNTIITFDELSLPAVRSVVLKNVGSTTIAAAELEILAQRTAISTRQMAQGAHRNLYGQKRARV